jgi:transcriptional regulator with XRE-family HTH domain
LREIAEHRLAQKIRELRQAKSMTLQQISEIAGLSKGLLSKIETCKVSPPIATLAKIAQALSVPLGEFFDWSEGDDALVFCPSSRRQAVRGRRTSSNYVYELLAPGRRHRDMQPTIVSIDGKRYKFSLLDHAGEQFVFLLEGEMDYIVGDKTYHLVPEDALYFDARAPHGPKLTKSQKARYLVVFSST